MCIFFSWLRKHYVLPEKPFYFYFYFSPFYLVIFQLRSWQYNAALVHLLYFSMSRCPPIFHQRLRCNSAGVLFYVFTFFFILFCKAGYVLCRQMSIVVIFAISFAKFYLVLWCLQWQIIAGQSLGRFLLSISTIRSWGVYVSWAESLDGVSAIIESHLDISCCKSHSCVKNSLCNLGDASSRFSGLLLVALFLTASNFLYTVQSIILHIYAKARGCFLTVHATISYVNSSICFKFPVIALPL